MRRTDKLRECVAVGECRPGHRSSKDTRRWCKGRIGVEHQWAWSQSVVKGADAATGERGFWVEHESCSGCGREKLHWPAFRRCHCGTLMQKPEPSPALIAKWGRKSASMRNYGPRVCMACGYEPSDEIAEEFVGGTYRKVRPRVPCKCEIEARKASNRIRHDRSNCTASTNSK